MPKVIFEFDYYEDREEIDSLRQCSDMGSALHEIYNMVRTKLKHGDEELSDDIENLLERIKEEANPFL